MSLTQKTLQEILAYLEKSIANLACESIQNLELNAQHQSVDKFLEEQFDIRLENLLVAKNSSIHHLESATKNMIIQRKQQIIQKALDKTV